MGENWEWTTDIFVQRDGEAQRNSIKDIDESEIFKGTENGTNIYSCFSVCFQAGKISLRYTGLLFSNHQFFRTLFLIYLIQTADLSLLSIRDDNHFTCCRCAR